MLNQVALSCTLLQRIGHNFSRRGQLMVSRKNDALELFFLHRAAQ